MREPEKFAFCGDWHGNTWWAVATIDAIRKQGGDTILHLGDYGFKFEDIFLLNVERACEENDVMLYFVDGNHDWHEFLWSLPLDEDGFGILSDHVRYIPRGTRWNWWGLTFMGLGGATSVDKADRVPYQEWWPTEAITRRDARIAIYGDKADLVGGPLGDPMPVDVMIAHDAPRGIPIPGISLEQGLKFFPHDALVTAEAHRGVMREIVDAVQPKLFVHGHYHRAYTHMQDGTRYAGLDMDGTEHNVWLVGNRFALIGFD